MNDDLFKTSLLYINGGWVNSTLPDTVPVIDPSTGKTMVRIAAGAPEDAYRAIDAARLAFAGWKKLGFERRLTYLERILECLRSKKESLIRASISQLGVPRSYAIEAHVENPLKIFEKILNDSRLFPFTEEQEGYVRKAEPLGIVLALTPWNAPLSGIIRRVVHALIAGNTVVLKPSRLAPLHAFIFALAAEEADLPPGVFNLINGKGANFGDQILTHPDIDLISYSGSTDFGRHIASVAGNQFIPVNLRCCANSPAVWLPGLKNYEKACRDLFDSVFLNAGQCSTSLSRLYVHESMLEETKSLMRRVIEEYPCGSPDESSSVVGPVISEKSYRRIRAMMVEAEMLGAKRFLGEIPPENPEKGFFIKPTVYYGVEPRMGLAKDEVFGPVLSVLTYRTIEEAVSLANLSPYGMVAAVVGPEKEAYAIADRIEAGQVYINEAPREPMAPACALKQSGLGYAGGKEGIENFVYFKTLFGKK